MYVCVAVASRCADAALFHSTAFESQRRSRAVVATALVKKLLIKKTKVPVLPVCLTVTRFQWIELESFVIFSLDKKEVT